MLLGVEGALRVLSVCECFENIHITQNTQNTHHITHNTLTTLITSLKTHSHHSNTLKAHPNHSGYLNRIDRMMWKEEMMEYSAATTPCRLMWLSVDTTG